MNPYALSEQQKAFYHANGYLIGLPPIYSADEMQAINADLPQLLALLRPDETAKDIREWHETSLYLYDLCMNPKIHDPGRRHPGPQLLPVGQQLLYEGALQQGDGRLAPGRLLLADEAAQHGHRLAGL